MAFQNLFAKKPLSPTNPQRAMSSPQLQPQDNGQEFEVPDFIDPTDLTDEELALIAKIYAETDQELFGMFHVLGSVPSTEEPSSDAW